VKSDVTRYRYGDEQHLEEALKRIFQYGLVSYDFNYLVGNLLFFVNYQFLHFNILLSRKLKNLELNIQVTIGSHFIACASNGPQDTLGSF
jgi:hypothetical protein